MDSTDLIFQAFKTRCPKCFESFEVSFEDVQYNDEITCRTCGNIFTLNIDAQALLPLLKRAEAHLSKKAEEKK